jgi:hypothetical protein
MERYDLPYRELEEKCADECEASRPCCGSWVIRVPNKTEFARALQARGKLGRKILADFELWLIADLGLANSTARRKLRLVWGCLCDYPDEPWMKVLNGHSGERCQGFRSWTYEQELRCALRDWLEWTLDDEEPDEDVRNKVRKMSETLSLDFEDMESRIAVRRAERRKWAREARKHRARRRV